MPTQTFMVTLHADNREQFEQHWKDSHLNFMELMRENLLDHLHVAADWSKAWLLIHAENRQAAMDLLKVLPLYAGSVIFEFDVLVGE